MLLDTGANVDIQDKSFGWLSLMWAISFGKTEVVNMLLDRGANFELQSNKKFMIKTDFSEQRIQDMIVGQSAWMYAIQNGHTDVVKMLLDQGANVDLQDEYGVTALMWASKYGHTKVVKMLLDNGVNVYHQNKDGISVLMVAIARGNAEVVKKGRERSPPDQGCNFGSDGCKCTSPYGGGENAARQGRHW